MELYRLSSGVKVPRSFNERETWKLKQTNTTPYTMIDTTAYSLKTPSLMVIVGVKMVRTIQVRDALKVELDKLVKDLRAHSISDVIELSIKALKLVKSIDPSLSILSLPEDKAIEELKRLLCGQQSTTMQTPQVIVMPMPWTPMPTQMPTMPQQQQPSIDLERMIAGLKNELEAMIRGYISRELEKLKAEVKREASRPQVVETQRPQVVFTTTPTTTPTPTTPTTTMSSTTTSSDDLPDWVKDNPWVSVIQSKHA